jgi:hypothetical protein
MAQINHNNLIKEGFVQIGEHLYTKENIYITHSGVAWQICDKNSNVGNEYVEIIEQIYMAINR